MSLGVKNVCTEQWRLYDLEAIINAIEDNIAAAITEKKISANQDYINIVLRTAGRAIVGMREILQLSAHGYPDGALAIARNLYENLIILAFFENQKNCGNYSDYIEDYYADFEVKRMKAWIYESQYCKQDTTETQRLNGELNVLKKNAHHKVGGEYWWSGHSSFSQLADSVINSVDNETLRNFLHTLHLTYKRACVSIHSSCMGNTLRLGAKPDFAGIDTAPTQNGHALPLWFSTTSFIYIVGVTCSVLEVDFGQYGMELNHLAEFFFKQGFDG